METGIRLADLLRRPQLSYEALQPVDESRPPLSPAVYREAEIRIKYAGYIARQKKAVEQFRKLENRKIPEGLDYMHMDGLCTEARQKLTKHQPKNLGQASRISGVSPADISVLLVYLQKGE